MLGQVALQACGRLRVAALPVQTLGLGFVLLRPAGVGAVVRGDVMTGAVQGLGTLTVAVK